MIRSRSRIRWLGLPLLAVCLALPSLSGATTFEELAEMVESEIPEDLILRMLETSAPPALTAAQLVDLWKRGASDDLLEALMPAKVEAGAAEEVVDPPAASPASGHAAGGDAAIRAYYENAPGGGQVFILTNLDDEGRRLDGKPTSGARPNMVTSRPPEPDPPPREQPPPPPAAYYPAPAPAPETGHAHQEVAYPQVTPTAYVPTGRGYGFFYSYPQSHFYPPGSHTHLKLYHKGGASGLGHYQLPLGQVFYNPPFPTAGTHRGSRLLWR